MVHPTGKTVKKAYSPLGKENNSEFSNRIVDVTHETYKLQPKRRTNARKSKKISQYSKTNITDPFHTIWEIPRTPTLVLPKTIHFDHDTTDADISVDFTLSTENSPRELEDTHHEIVPTPQTDITLPTTSDTPHLTFLASPANEDLKLLLDGFTCTKYGRRGKPHERYIWLTEDKKTIFWKAPNKQEKERFVLVRNVTAVQIGANTKVFKRYPRVQQSLCLSLILDGKKSSLDLSFASEAERDIFAQNFELLCK